MVIRFEFVFLHEPQVGFKQALHTVTVIFLQVLALTPLWCCSLWNIHSIGLWCTLLWQYSSESCLQRFRMNWRRDIVCPVAFLKTRGIFADASYDEKLIDRFLQLMRTMQKCNSEDRSSLTTGWFFSIDECQDSKVLATIKFDNSIILAIIWISHDSYLIASFC